MRRNLLLLTLVLLLSFGSPKVYAGGGPDVYGYIWLDSNDPGGPVYNWIDISQLPSATQVTGLADDNSSGPYGIGFDFHYYWSDYNEVKIGSNGWVSFKTAVGNVAHCFPTVPSPGGNADNFLAPFMTDLNFNGSLNPGQVWFWTNVAADTFIVQYETCPWWVNAVPDYTSGTNTFQVILTSVDSSITFQYNTMAPTSFNDTPGCASDCEIGMENVTGNIGLECWNETIPPDAYAIKFFYPAVVTFQIYDVAPNWNGNAANAGQFVLLGNSVTFISDIKNTGNVDMNDPTNVTCKIKPLALVPITYQSSTTIDTIPLNSSELATFSPAFTFTTPGQYYFETETANGSDINPSNNLNTVEVSVVEADPMGNIGLTYSTLNPPDGALAWSGGNWNDGGGVYMVPPQYPVTLHTVEMYINQGAFNPANNSSYLVMVLDDDGPNGTPGTILSVSRERSFI